MKIRFFNYWKATRELELNLIGKTWSFRIGTHQLALWRKFDPLFNFARMRTFHEWYSLPLDGSTL